jgi:hypothetical protein
MLLRSGLEEKPLLLKYFKFFLTTDIKSPNMEQVMSIIKMFLTIDTKINDIQRL